MNKQQSRLGRARQTRLRIRSLRGIRLSVRRSNKHIYAVIFDAQQSVLTSASTLEADLRTTLSGKSSCDLDAATIVGERIAKKALALGIDRLAFDRSGYKYHGRVRALAEAARLAGLQF